MKRILVLAACGLLGFVSSLRAEVVEVKVKNPSFHRLWLADVKAP